MKMENDEETINALLTDLVGCRLSANTLMWCNLCAFIIILSQFVSCVCPIH